MTKDQLKELAQSRVEANSLESSEIEVGLGFYQAGFLKALELVLDDLFNPGDPTMLEEDQLGYHLQNIQTKYQELVKVN